MTRQGCKEAGDCVAFEKLGMETSLIASPVEREPTTGESDLLRQCLNERCISVGLKMPILSAPAFIVMPTVTKYHRLCAQSPPAFLGCPDSGRDMSPCENLKAKLQ